MSTFQVRFKTFPDTEHKGGVLLTYEEASSLSPVKTPMQIAFENPAALDAAFQRSGIYLARPDPHSGNEHSPRHEQNYEVTKAALEQIGFRFDD
jgi:hypothetical protein